MNRIKYRKIRVFVHVIFWAAVLIFYTVLFGSEKGNYANAFYFVVWLLPITIATTYFLIYFLIPEFLLPKKYFRFALFLFYTIVISITLELNVVIFNFLFVALYSDFNRMVPASFNIFYLIAGNYLVVFLAVAIKLVEQWYRMERKTMNLQKESIEIELKLKEAELKLLKAQIHPHFLFNTLNNLYGLTLKGSEKSPEVVLKISSLLDYMIYRSTQPMVRLEEEIRYILDFISLEELRYDNLKLEVICDDTVNDYYIAPLILQPFVENAFKHGTGKDISSPWIKMIITLKDPDGFYFSIENSKIPNPEEVPGGSSPGIGLKNVKERLKIIYPENYTLEIDDGNETFRIVLTLKLRKKI